LDSAIVPQEGAFCAFYPLSSVSTCNSQCCVLLILGEIKVLRGPECVACMHCCFAPTTCLALDKPLSSNSLCIHNLLRRYVGFKEPLKLLMGTAFDCEHVSHSANLPPLWYAKTQSDKTAVESHLLLQIIDGQVPAMTIRVEPMVERDLVQIRGDDLRAQFMRLRAHKRNVPAS
jgi:hypothetical protein